jgi:hypothetical protein
VKTDIRRTRHHQADWETNMNFETSEDRHKENQPPPSRIRENYDFLEN